MKARNLGEWCWRCCAALYWIGLVLVIARGCNLLACRWRWVFLPWAGIVALFSSVLLFVLVTAAVEEGRAARERRRQQSPGTFPFEH